MERKQLNRLLLFFLLLIWGVLIVKFVRPYFAKKKVIFLVEETIESESYAFFKKDTFLLKAISRDPFLGVVKKEKKQVKFSKTKKNSVKKNIKWPKVSYLGYVKSSQNKFKLGLVRIESKLFKVRNKDILTSRELKVVSVRSDSIGLRLNKEVKFFKRK